MTSFLGKKKNNGDKMVKPLRVQDKKQIEEIVVLLHNVAYKISNEMSKYQTRNTDTIVQIGYCLIKDNDTTKIIYMDIKDGKTYIDIGNNNKMYLNTKTDILYIYDDIIARIDKQKAEIIAENKKMYQNGEKVKQMLKDVL